MPSPQLPFGGTQQQRLAEVREAKLRTPGFQERRLMHSWKRAAKAGTDEAIAAHQKLAASLTPCIEAEWSVCDD